MKAIHYDSTYSINYLQKQHTKPIISAPLYFRVHHNNVCQRINHPETGARWSQYAVGQVAHMQLSEVYMPCYRTQYVI
jgi:hypothetical protein